MLEFLCINCRATIEADETQRRQRIVCTNCNTRQVVPADAPAYPASPEQLAQVASHYAAPPREPKPPEYLLAQSLDFISLVCGLLGCAVAMTLASPHPLLMLSASIPFLVLIALGQILGMVRHIAINTWHIRHKK